MYHGFTYEYERWDHSPAVTMFNVSPIANAIEFLEFQRAIDSNTTHTTYDCAIETLAAISTAEDPNEEGYTERNQAVAQFFQELFDRRMILEVTN